MNNTPQVYPTPTQQQMQPRTTSSYPPGRQTVSGLDRYFAFERYPS